MMTFLIIITLLSLFIPLYVYLGYPLLLIVLDKLIKEKPVYKGNNTPSVSLIVSCYNERNVIGKKLENCLALDYPNDRLEILFVSDGSDDGTDEVINEFKSDQIKLIRQEGRFGKTSGLNLAVPQCIGEVVVFSDANALYERNAIRMLVRNFHDEKVGYVVGAALYRDHNESAASSSEALYWQYELTMKKIESKLHSVIGGDGAIYAIRKNLYQTLDKEDINDFVNPLQIIAKGYRGVFEAEAICYEQTAGNFYSEGRRKQRIVNRSFSGLVKNMSVLNPFRYGIYAIGLVSHKLLRWLVPFFVITAGVGVVALAQLDIVFFQYCLLIGIFCLWCIIAGVVLRLWPACPSYLMYPYYFYLVNANALIGVLQSLRGRVQVTWTTHRDSPGTASKVGIAKSLVVAIVFLLSIWLFNNTLQSVIASNENNKSFTIHKSNRVLWGRTMDPRSK